MKSKLGNRIEIMMKMKMKTKARSKSCLPSETKILRILSKIRFCLTPTWSEHFWVHLHVLISMLDDVTNVMKHEANERSWISFQMRRKNGNPETDNFPEGCGVGMERSNRPRASDPLMICERRTKSLINRNQYCEILFSVSRSRKNCIIAHRIPSVFTLNTQLNMLDGLCRRAERRRS